MKLTETQKNFRKQMKEIKFDKDDHFSYRNHRRNVRFMESEQTPRSHNPIGTITGVIFLIYMIVRLVDYLIHIFRA